jgi:tetratricopeptide (TPR) repeat protein
MLARIGTALFYALFFFAVGAWVASTSPSVHDAARLASEVGARSFERLTAWTVGTLTSLRTAPPPAAREEPSRPAPAQLQMTAPPPPPAAPADTNLLDKARASFARQDINGAINAYRDFLIQTPNDVNALGELGNVYFSVGRQHDAAEVYYDAALILLTKNDPEHATLIATAIRQGNPQLADDLLRRINATTQNNPNTNTNTNTQATDGK